MALFLAENVAVPLAAIGVCLAAGFVLLCVGNGLIRYVTTDRKVR